jgi:hypothetical protein
MNVFCKYWNPTLVGHNEGNSVDVQYRNFVLIFAYILSSVVLTLCSALLISSGLVETPFVLGSVLIYMTL